MVIDSRIKSMVDTTTTKWHFNSPAYNVWVPHLAPSPSLRRAGRLSPSTFLCGEADCEAPEVIYAASAKAAGYGETARCDQPWGE